MKNQTNNIFPIEPETKHKEPERMTSLSPKKQIIEKNKQPAPLQNNNNHSQNISIYEYFDQ